MILVFHNLEWHDENINLWVKFPSLGWSSRKCYIEKTGYLNCTETAHIWQFLQRLFVYFCMLIIPIGGQMITWLQNVLGLDFLRSFKKKKRTSIHIVKPYSVLAEFDQAHRMSLHQQEPSSHMGARKANKTSVMWPVLEWVHKCNSSLLNELQGHILFSLMEQTTDYVVRRMWDLTEVASVCSHITGPFGLIITEWIDALQSQEWQPCQLTHTQTPFLNGKTTCKLATLPESS